MPPSLCPSPYTSLDLLFHPHPNPQPTCLAGAAPPPLALQLHLQPGRRRGASIRECIHLWRGANPTSPHPSWDAAREAARLGHQGCSLILPGDPSSHSWKGTQVSSCPGPSALRLPPKTQTEHQWHLGSQPQVSNPPSLHSFPGARENPGVPAPSPPAQTYQAQLPSQS